MRWGGNFQQDFGLKVPTRRRWPRWVSEDNTVTDLEVMAFSGVNWIYLGHGRKHRRVSVITEMKLTTPYFGHLRDCYAPQSRLSYSYVSLISTGTWWLWSGFGSRCQYVMQSLRVCVISIRTSTAALPVSRLTERSTIDMLLFDMSQSHHWKRKARGLSELTSSGESAAFLSLSGRRFLLPLEWNVHIYWNISFITY